VEISPILAASGRMTGRPGGACWPERAWQRYFSQFSN